MISIQDLLRSSNEDTYHIAQLLRDKRLKNGKQNVEQHRVVDHVDAPQPERARLLGPVQDHAGVLRRVLGDLRHREALGVEDDLHAVQLGLRVEQGGLHRKPDGGDQLDDRYL